MSVPDFIRLIRRSNLPPDAYVVVTRKQADLCPTLGVSLFDGEVWNITITALWETDEVGDSAGDNVAEYHSTQPT